MKDRGKGPRAKRRIQVTGDYTYMLTLPKDWVRRLGWRARQILELELRSGKIVMRREHDDAGLRAPGTSPETRSP